jgi:hypothetical protein
MNSRPNASSPVANDTLAGIIAWVSFRELAFVPNNPQISGLWSVAMTQVAEPPTAVKPAPARSFQHSLDPVQEDYGYRPVPMTAVVGAVLAFLSISALIAWLAIPVAVIATVVCLIAVVQIARSRGEFAGMWLAGLGLATSLVMAVGGVLLTMHRYKTEIPPGYERVSFARDIAAKGIGMAEENGKRGIVLPEEVRALEGKKIYLKGYMYPQGRPNFLTTFVLCKDNAECCFGGQPALTDMIGVTMSGKQTTDFTPDLVGVAGTLKFNESYRGGDLEPIYLLEAEEVAPALTSL